MKQQWLGITYWTGIRSDFKEYFNIFFPNNMDPDHFSILYNKGILYNSSSH